MMLLSSPHLTTRLYGLQEASATNQSILPTRRPTNPVSPCLTILLPTRTVLAYLERRMHSARTLPSPILITVPSSRFHQPTAPNPRRHTPGHTVQPSQDTAYTQKLRRPAFNSPLDLPASSYPLVHRHMLACAPMRVRARSPHPCFRKAASGRRWLCLE